MTDEQITDALKEVGAAWLMDPNDEHCQACAICHVVGAAVAAERERWQRIATNAQAVTTECEDRLDHFEVPAHLMAALALALDEWPNVRAKPGATVPRCDSA